MSSQGDLITTTRGELQALIKEACDEAVGRAITQAFRDVGIIAHDDEAVDHRRRDFQFLHDLRLSSESAKSRIGAALLLVTVSGMVALFVSGFKLWARQ